MAVWRERYKYYVIVARTLSIIVSEVVLTSGQFNLKYAPNESVKPTAAYWTRIIKKSWVTMDKGNCNVTM